MLSLREWSHENVKYGSHFIGNGRFADYMWYKAGRIDTNGSGGMMGGPEMGLGGMVRPEQPDGMQPPAQGQRPPEGFMPPEGNRQDNPWGNNFGAQGLTSDFVIGDGGNMFSVILPNR